MAQKVCVVFGFGPGIGAACARRWLQEGFKVAILARNKEKLQAFEAKHGGSGITKGYSCDVTNRQQMETAVTQIEADLGPIHTMVYNAGKNFLCVFFLSERSRNTSARPLNYYQTVVLVTFG